MNCTTIQSIEINDDNKMFVPSTGILFGTFSNVDTMFCIRTYCKDTALYGNIISVIQV